MSRSAHYKPRMNLAQRDGAVVNALQTVVESNHRWGFWKCYGALRLAGQSWNHKRVHRVYCKLRLNLPRRTKRRVPKRIKQPLLAPETLNQTWAIDFMHDRLYDGRCFRTFNVIDESNREGLGIEISPSLPSTRVIAMLEQLIMQHGKPARIRCDNGPEFTSLALTHWCTEQGIELQYIQPAKPAQNAFMERFNRTYRTEVLDAYVFESLADVRELTEEWLVTYNTKRPHDSLGRVPPRTYLPRLTAVEESSYAVST